MERRPPERGAAQHEAGERGAPEDEDKGTGGRRQDRYLKGEAQAQAQVRGGQEAERRGPQKQKQKPGQIS